MNIATKIDAELNRLSQIDLAASGNAFQIACPQGDLVCRMADVDAIGCGFWDLSFQTDQLANADSGRLKSLCDDLSKRLNYLLEPIQLSELDGESCVAQMRSNPPSRDDDQTTYYELLARRGGELRLHRYRKPIGQPRETVVAHVTREVLKRLAQDLSTI